MDVDALHEQEVQRGAQKAKADYIESHPGSSKMRLDFDPMKDLNKE